MIASPGLEIRQCIEALRSGVPSDAAVRMLGTTQLRVEKTFGKALEGIKAGGKTPPLVIDANFGDGKSHLLHFLRVKAEAEGFVTSSVVIGPDAPIGNAHVTLKAIAEEARAPGRTGKALPELAAGASREAVADLRRWLQDAGVEDRFRALFRVYEATHDEELRVMILGDIEGKPLAKTRLSAELRALGELSHFHLKSPRNALLAHDRIRVFSQFCRSHGHFGLIVFFDELERIANFSFKSRLAAYQELGWWRSVCQDASIPIVAVFAQTSGAVEQCLVDKGDEGRIHTERFMDARDELAKGGVDLLRSSVRLERATNADLETLQFGVRDMYRQAYGHPPAAVAPRPAWTTVRGEIRRWITQWDLARHYPEYRADVLVEAVRQDVDEISDDLVSDDDGPEG